MALFLLLTACASSAGAPDRPEPFAPFNAPAHPQTVRLVVRNRNFSDARIYALRPGGRQSLGIVGGKQDGEFVMRWLSPQSLSIEIDLLAGPRCTTEELQVDPGDILELQIESVFFDTSNCR